MLMLLGINKKGSSGLENARPAISSTVIPNYADALHTHSHRNQLVLISERLWRANQLQQEHSHCA